MVDEIEALVRMNFQFHLLDSVKRFMNKLFFKLFILSIPFIGFEEFVEERWFEEEREAFNSIYWIQPTTTTIETEVTGEEAFNSIYWIQRHYQES